MNDPGDPSNDLAPLDLMGSATSFARTSMAAHLDANEALFFLHAATSMEHLLKAYLHSLHPAMIREVGKQQHNLMDVLLHAAGHGNKAGAPLEKMRSINASESLTRCTRLMEDLRPFEIDLRSLFNVRNGVAHVGEIREAKKDHVLASFLNSSRVLLAQLSVDPDIYWGTYAESVRVRIEQHAEAVKVAVSDAITRARSTFTQRFGDGDDHDVAIQAIESTYDPDGLYTRTIECPACGRTALLNGNFDVDWDIDAEADRFTGETMISGVFAVGASFRARELQCRICFLSLKGREQLDGAKIAWSIELEGEDIERAEEEFVQNQYNKNAELYHDYSDDWR